MYKDLKIHIPPEDLQLTACQFFIKYEPCFHTAFNWVVLTCESYRRYMDMLSKYLSIPICDADADDYESAILEMNQHKKRPYSSNTLKTIKSVINDICYFIETYYDGFFRSNMWGTAWNTERKISDPKAKRKDILNEQIDCKLRIPRSMSIPEEIKFLDQVNENYINNSFYLGAAIIFYLGLRPGECCGLKFSDIRPLSGYTGVQCLYIYEQIRSTSEKTYELKTTNAYRILPIPTELYVLLWRREQKLKAEMGSAFTTDIPVVCMAESLNGYTEHCNAKKFMQHCTNLLRKCEVAESTMNELSMELREDNPFKEAAATGYLLRRNFATAIAGVCGMTEDEINYMMGHAIYIPDERRADFLNPDVLFKLFKKLNRRHYAPLPKDTNSFEIKDSLQVIHQREAEITVQDDIFKTHPNGIKFTVWDDYPNDYIEIKRLSDGGPELEIHPIYQHVPLRKAERVWMSREFTEAVGTSRKRSQAKKKSG